MTRTTRTTRTVIVAAATIGLAAGMATAVVPADATRTTAVATSVASASTDNRQVIRTLKAEIPAMLTEANIAGATVALVAGDRVLMAKGFGWADRAKRRPVTSKTLFHIGSVSKTFAAASVLQLVERGLVDLDAPLTRYVPRLRQTPLAPSGAEGRFKRNTITVRSVLDHHSGIPGDVFYRMMTFGKPDPGFGDWLLRALRRMPPERRVNTAYAYNNSGYVLLRYLVENVTGEPYAERTARTLFKRMGMRSSTFDDTLPPGRALTRNYSPVLDRQGQPTGDLKADPREYVNGWTAGSILSSARDMAKYLRTLIHRGRGDNGRVVKVSTLRRMTTTQLYRPLDGPNRLGLSWFLSNSWVGHTFGHDGATTRNFTSVLVHPTQRLGVFVSTNTVGGSAVSSAIAARAFSLMYSAKTGIPRPAPEALPVAPARTPTTAELAAAAGRYSGYTDYRDVSVSGDQLVLTNYPVGKPPTNAEFTAMNNGWWRTDADPNLQIAFRKVEGKQVLVYRNGGGVPPVHTLVLGMKVPQVDPSRTWRRAAGRYRTTFKESRRTDLLSNDLRLRVTADSAVLQLGTNGEETHVLNPVQGDRAYTYGWAATGGRRQGDIVRLKGNKITYMGMVYRKVK